MKYLPVKIDQLPPLDQYWDKPTLDKNGDEHPDGIFIEMGKCLSKWESLETSFAELFAYFIESRSNVARRAYGYATVGREDILRGAAEAFFLNHQADDETKRHFNIIMRHKQRGSKFRNEIAHGVVSELLSEKSFGFFLVPAPYNSKKIETFIRRNRNVIPEEKFTVFDLMGCKYFYKSYHIRLVSNKFEVLQKCVWSFLGDLMHNYPNDIMVNFPKP